MSTFPRLLCLFVCLFIAENATADPITYTYAGNAFRSGIGLVTAESFVRGEATIDFNGIAGIYQATAWSLSVETPGGTLVSVSNNDIATKLTSFLNEFTLDSDGSITDWKLAAVGQFYGTPESKIEILYTQKGVSTTEDFVLLDSNVIGCSGEPTCSFGHLILGPGTWSVPEPSSLALLAAGLVTCALMRFRRDPER